MKTNNEKKHENTCARGKILKSNNVEEHNSNFSSKGVCSCISCVLVDITAPLFERFDQLLGTTTRMLELLEDKADLAVDLKEQLIDNYDLKEILKVKDTKFYTLKKLFKSYELENKPYYLQSEVLKVIRQHLLKSDDDIGMG